ncbi:MAG: hypothetical protein NVSMB49_05200 [Ktedonobacteraceae bacterium]
MEILETELLATLSHELRGPLASVQGYTATLLKRGDTISYDERQEFLVAITDAGRQLEVVIDRLLEIAQLETGMLALERTTIDLVALVQQALLQTEDRLQQSLLALPPFTFSLLLEGNERGQTQREQHIHGDARRLKEVIDHLLENAMLYSPHGGAIELGIRQHRHLQMVEMWIRDNGRGIPRDLLHRIFWRFHRVDMRLTRETAGLGLGLTICKHIIELHNGVIWAESAPDKGSMFHVLLPVERQ